MDTIPNHLLIESILVFVEPIELLQSLSYVSKRFASIIVLDSQQIWKKLLEVYLDQQQQQQQQQSDNNNVTNNNTTNTETDNSRTIRRNYNNNNHNNNHTNNLTIHQIQRLCLFITTPTASIHNINASSSNIVNREEDDEEDEGNNNNNNNKNKQHYNNNDYYNKCLDYGSVIPNRGLAMHIRQRSNGLLRSCLASTTDQDSEIIENILFNDTDFFFRFFPINFFYWSSKPTENERSNEILLFTTKHPNTVISEIAIKPLTDPDFPNKFYTWKNIQIKAYHLNYSSAEEGMTQSNYNYNNNNNNITDDVMELPTAGLQSSICVINATAEENVNNNNNNNNNNDEEQGQGGGDDGNGAEGQQLNLNQHTTRGDDEYTIKRVLENQTPVYESIVHGTPSPNCVDWQNIILPKGEVVIANVITITLIGKNTRQFHDSGYYACVQNVKIRGIPLYVNKEEQQQQQQQQQQQHHDGAAGGGQGGGKVLLLSGRRENIV